MAFFGKDYDQVQVGGDFKTLPAGGYVCTIKKAKAGETSAGLPRVEAMYDIAEGEYARYFKDRYDASIKEDHNAKWPYHGTLRVTAVDENGNTKKMFKSFCTAVEQSNDVKLPRDDDKAFLKALEGMTIGVIFGREEYEDTFGHRRWATKPRWYRSAEAIRSGDYQIPDDVPYQPQSSGYTYGAGFQSADSFSAAEDDIPF